MSGGEPSSIKQKPSCAADLPILSPKCGKAAGCVYSNYLCAVLWGAERFSIETTLSIEGDNMKACGSTNPAGQKFLPMVVKLLLRLIKPTHMSRVFMNIPALPKCSIEWRTKSARGRFEAGLRPSLYFIEGRIFVCIRLYTANGGRRRLRM